MNRDDAQGDARCRGHVVDFSCRPSVVSLCVPARLAADCQGAKWNAAGRPRDDVSAATPLPPSGLAVV